MSSWGLADAASWAAASPAASAPTLGGMTQGAPTLAGPGARFDPVTEEQLEQWVQAKRDKDWATADALRADLRARGIEPDTVRPPGWGTEQFKAPAYAPEVEAKMDQWVAAKRQKDFATADAIRAELRAEGIDPDTARPSDKDMQQGGPAAGMMMQGGPAAGMMMQGAMQPQRKFDDFTEMQLELWVKAKRDKDFATADAIREELRKQGIDPDTVRPSSRDVQQQGPGGANPGMTPPLPAGPVSAATVASGQLQKFLIASQYQQQYEEATAWSAGPGQQYGGGLFGQSAWAGLQAGAASKLNAGMYDQETEAQLDRWVAAKREKNFQEADSIRADLRAKGIDPDTARPSDRDMKGGMMGGKQDAMVEKMLDRWVEAKRVKAFQTADALRQQLRDMGIDPDTVRPSDRSGGEDWLMASKRARGNGMW